MTPCVTLSRFKSFAMTIPPVPHSVQRFSILMDQQHIETWYSLKEWNLNNTEKLGTHSKNGSTTQRNLVLTQIMDQQYTLKKRFVSCLVLAIFLLKDSSKITPQSSGRDFDAHEAADAVGHPTANGCWRS